MDEWKSLIVVRVMTGGKGCNSGNPRAFLREPGWGRERERDCPWDAVTRITAAACDDLEVLQWARAHDCPWNLEICAEAALSGHLEVLH